MNNQKPILGIIGAGKLGTVVAQLALKAGYTVYIAGSGAAEKIQLSVEIITPGAMPVTAEEAVKNCDIVILALPLSKYRNLPVTAFKGKLVIDATNYWWEVDGKMPELEQWPSSSEMIQAFLSNARIVKALSHIGYHNLLDDARPVGAADRKGMAIAGNNGHDTQQVAALVADLGFDPVIIGPLADGKKLEPGNPLFGASVDAHNVRKIAEDNNFYIDNKNMGKEVVS